MYNKVLLPYRYRNTSGDFNVIARNDNGFFRQVFTPDEMQRLDRLVLPYVQNNLISCWEYLRGENMGVMIAKGQEQKEDVIFAVTKIMSADQVTRWMINFPTIHGISKTNNFDEVLRLGRHHLDNLRPATIPNLNPVL